MLKQLMKQKEMKRMLLYLMREHDCLRWKEREEIAKDTGLPDGVVDTFLRKVDPYGSGDYWSRITEILEKESKFLIRKLMSKQPVDMEDAKRVIEVVCAEKYIPYSNELAKKAIENLTKFSDVTDRQPSYDFVVSSIMLARKQLGGIERCVEIQKLPVFKEMLEAVDGIPAPSERVKLYVTKILTQVGLSEEERRTILKSSINDYEAAKQKDPTIVGKDPAGLAAALVYLNMNKIGYSGRRHTQRDFAKYSGRTEVTVRKLYLLLDEILNPQLIAELKWTCLPLNEEEVLKNIQGVQKIYKLLGQNEFRGSDMRRVDWEMGHPFGYDSLGNILYKMGLTERKPIILHSHRYVYKFKTDEKTRRLLESSPL